MSRGETPRADDVDAVRRLLGREPQGDFTVVVRDADGFPVVLRNSPILHDGTPMPTLFWLVGKKEVAEVGRLESSGAVNRVEHELGLDAIDKVHRAYEAERSRDIPVDHVGPVPTGGVGGTRQGVKCLHAHLAYWLAGGDDPVGEWTSRQLSVLGAHIAERVSS